MLQFQGMIAEYDGREILSTVPRGKRHHAKAGEVSVLGGAPYRYRYIHKTQRGLGTLQQRAAEAEVVRLVYHQYPWTT